MGVCNCSSKFCCTLLYVHPSIATILIGKRELIALLNLSSWCLVMVERLFLAVPRGCLPFVIVVFPDHTHLLFFKDWIKKLKLCVSVNGEYFKGSKYIKMQCHFSFHLASFVALLLILPSYSDKWYQIYFACT